MSWLLLYLLIGVACVAYVIHDEQPDAITLGEGFFAVFLVIAWPLIVWYYVAEEGILDDIIIWKNKDKK